MFTSILKAFGEALHNLRSNFFQTLLSVLGIIIGVGALVTMLSLVDGLETFARNKVAGTTDMESISISSNSHQNVDGIRVKRDTVVNLDAATKKALMEQLPFAAKGQLVSGGSELLRHPETDSTMGVRYVATTLPILDTTQLKIRFGRMLEAEDETENRAVALVNSALAMRLLGDGATDTSAVLGKKFTIQNRLVEVVGVAERGAIKGLASIIPLGLMESAGNGPIKPQLLINFASVEDVQAGKEFIEGWLKTRYADVEDPFSVSSQEFWLEEMRKSFLLFRLIMGLIVGIAVVVGGVGVMNVLLMSITERTAEIGIRKAVGANRKTILSQFLAESVAISLIGSFFGILLGISVALIIAPVVSIFYPDLTDFNAQLSLTTILVVGLIAVVTGIVFGTYPARKAAGMDPVAAIQRS